MDRGLDAHLQRIIENASEYAGHLEPESSFEYLARPEEERQPLERYYSTGLQQLSREPTSFSPYGTFMFEALEDRF